MVKRFAGLEKNLRLAAYVLLLEVMAGLSLAALLPLVGVGRDWIVPVVWAINLPAAWFLAHAAKRQGRNAWLSGFISLPPLFAAVNFLSLWATANVQGNEA